MADCEHSAVHLEMRDVYTSEDEAQDFAAWQAGHRHDPTDRASWWTPWLDLIAATTARGVTVRRARVVSQPVTTYIAYEHACTHQNIAAGEHVRWLPRSRASDLLLPGNDLWVMDDRLVRFNLFTGNGEFLHHVDLHDAALAKQCVTAFEAVWERAVPHEDFEV
ncbi:hypothetical protein GT354_37145 [Streptomyces sp. SID3343]|nr:hypothetical protein [Streptomyces sp. SID3343]